MGNQINLKLSDKMINSAKLVAEIKGYDNLQDYIREVMRKDLFEGENTSGLLTYKASEEALAKNWLSKKEDKAWKHLQKEM